MGLDTFVFFSIGRDGATEGKAISHVLLPVGPLEGFVGRGTAVDKPDGVEEKSPDEGRCKDGEQSGGAHVYIVLDAPAPDGGVLGHGHVLGLPERPAGAPRLHAGHQDGHSQSAAVDGDEARGQEEQQEPVVVAVADARVDEDAVVVRPRHALLADAAVLGARGLEEAAGPALVARVEERVVVGVEAHVVRVVLPRDVARVAGAAEVEKRVGHGDGDDHGQLSEPPNLGPHCRDKEIFCNAKYSYEEHLTKRSQ